MIQPTAQVPTVPSLPISDTPPIIQPPAQAPTLPSANTTAPNPHPIPYINSGFAPNPNQALFPCFAPDLTQMVSPALYSPSNANPQQSWVDFLSDPLYNWPNPDETGNQNLFDFPDQDFSRMNNFGDGRLDINVRLLLQSLHILIYIHSLPLSHCRTATISTATLTQISTPFLY
jgi:hypothetical protein